MRDSKRYKDSIEYAFDCTSISSEKWDSIMDNAKKANGVKIRAMIKKQLPDIYKLLALGFCNPWEEQSQVTDKYYIYVHSSIEYFLRRK